MSKSNETSIEKFEEKEFQYFFKHIEILEFSETEKEEVATSITVSAK
jgi:hypothetical protein